MTGPPPAAMVPDAPARLSAILGRVPGLRERRLEIIESWATVIALSGTPVFRDFPLAAKFGRRVASALAVCLRAQDSPAILTLADALWERGVTLHRAGMDPCAWRREWTATTPIIEQLEDRLASTISELKAEHSRIGQQIVALGGERPLPYEPGEDDNLGLDNIDDVGGTIDQFEKLARLLAPVWQHMSSMHHGALISISVALGDRRGRDILRDQVELLQAVERVSRRLAELPATARRKHKAEHVRARIVAEFAAAAFHAVTGQPPTTTPDAVNDDARAFVTLVEDVFEGLHITASAAWWARHARETFSPERIVASAPDSLLWTGS